MKVVIAEKPSVAADIARVLGATAKEDGFYMGNGYQVTWAFGHLVKLKEPESYGFSKNWNIEELPIVPEKFEIELIDEPYIKKQFGVIKKLFSNCEKICIATDAGREGELIFRYIYALTGVKKPLLRLWISSLTDESIRNGFMNVKPAAAYDNLFNSARSRNEADWLFGLNATRALTCVNNSGIVSIGRVQTPTLSMVCKAFLDNKNFIAKKYYMVEAVLSLDGISFKAAYNEQFEGELKALPTLNEIGSTIPCSKREMKEVRESSPLLFDLTSLQQTANKEFGFKAQKTLDIAQSLYEKHKLLTYPRTGSKYLSEDMREVVAKLFILVDSWNLDDKINNALKSVNPSVDRNFNNDKVTDHHAIILTNVKPNLTQLSEDEKNIYMLVATRFVQSYMPDCKKIKTALQFALKNGCLIANGVQITQSGWSHLSKVGNKEDSEEQNLPGVNQGSLCKVESKEIVGKKTTPPKLLTEAQLLHLMETAGKVVMDENAKLALKDIGIGTPATRASIIETLFKRKYIQNVGKNNIIPTDKGLSVYDIVKDMSFASPELTGAWELKLNEIASGNMSNVVFDSQIRDYIGGVVSELSNTNNGSVKLTETRFLGLKCPKCKVGDIGIGKKKYFCTEWKKGCDFGIYFSVYNKKISEKNVTDLVTKGKTTEIKGFSGRSGKKFNCVLTLTKEFKIVPEGFK